MDQNALLITAIVGVVLGGIGLIGGVLGYVQSTAAVRRSTHARQRAVAAEEEALRAKAAAEATLRSAEELAERFRGGPMRSQTGPLGTPRYANTPQTRWEQPTTGPSQTGPMQTGAMQIGPQQTGSASMPEPTPMAEPTTGATLLPDTGPTAVRVRPADQAPGRESGPLPVQPDPRPTVGEPEAAVGSERAEALDPPAAGPAPVDGPDAGDAGSVQEAAEPQDPEPEPEPEPATLSEPEVEVPGPAERTAPAPTEAETPDEGSAPGLDSAPGGPEDAASGPPEREPVVVQGPAVQSEQESVSAEPQRAAVPDEQPGGESPSDDRAPEEPAAEGPGEEEQDGRDSSGRVIAGGQDAPTMDWAEVLRTGAIPLPSISRGTYSAPRRRPKPTGEGPARFELRAIGRQRYEAVNMGAEPALEARITGTGDDPHLVRPLSSRPATVAPGGTLPFSVLRVEGREVSVQVVHQVAGEPVHQDLPLD